mmetsp:Transcript_5935/g.15480  ORF Transcript_5935/g.15480 Transcript_5935/m.15480 type:complete len:254 (+) Transcript_5935:691-1452(+)
MPQLQKKRPRGRARRRALCRTMRHGRRRSRRSTTTWRRSVRGASAPPQLSPCSCPIARRLWSRRSQRSSSRRWLRLRRLISSHGFARPPLAPRPPCCQRRRTPSPPNAVLSVRSRRARTWPLIHLTTPSQELRCLCPNPASPMRPTRLTIGRTTSSLPSGRRSMRAWPGCVRNAMLPTRLQTTRATQLSSRAMLSQKRSARVPRWRRLPSVLPSVLPSGLPRRKSGGASERRARPGWPPPARTSRLLRPGFLA